MRPRLVIILIWFLGLWCIFLLRGFQLQVLPSENIKLARSKQYQRVVKLNSKRGDIFDRNGKELAISVPAYSLFADPTLIKHPRLLSLKLSKVLNLSQKDILRKIKKPNTRFVWIQRLLNEDVRNKITKWDEKGLGFKEEFKRVYPNKNALSHVIGFVGADGRGLEGVESQYDSFLRADLQEFNLPKDARGRFLVEDGWIFMQDRDGEDVYLTIDSDLQFFVEQELKKAVEYHEAEGAWAVVMDPRTSEILAISSQPDYDLNAPMLASSAQRRSRVFADVYEPGSTMKTIFMAGAIREGVIEPNTVIDTSGGKIEVDGRIIKEADEQHQHKKLTATEILAFSSNVGVTKIALQMKDQQIFQTMRDFGFGEKTGLDLLGEPKGILAPPPWRNHRKANISFGHGVAVTAMQMANAYGAIANNGVLNKPFLVKQKRGIDGQLTVTTPQPLHRVLTVKEASKLKMMLTATTSEHGTGTMARVKGFSVAGKTGTAQKVNADGGGYKQGEYISSFIGFLPANAPEILIYVVIDNPKKHGYYATQTAAPVFSKIAEFTINRRGIAPVLIAEKDIIKTEEKTIADKAAQTPASVVVVPNMEGWSLRETLRFMRAKDVDYKVVGKKGRVVKTTPSEGEAWPSDQQPFTIFIE